MTVLDLTSAITAVFIAGMVWLRARMQYLGSANRQGTGKPQLTRQGRLYFAAVAVLLAIGWLIAPTVGATFWPHSGASPTLMRVIWFLTSYYLFILVHRYLKTRGVAVFATRA